MNIQILPLGEETCLLRIKRDGGEYTERVLPIDELGAAIDALEESLKKASQEEMK